MQLTVDIKYEQLIDIIRNLPANQLAKIKSDLENAVAVNKSGTDKTDFQKFLLKGPVMSDDRILPLRRIEKHLINGEASNLFGHFRVIEAPQ